MDFLKKIEQKNNCIVTNFQYLGGKKYGFNYKRRDFVYPEGSLIPRYEGELNEEGEFEGQGRIVNSDHTYVGNWLKGKKHGHGVMVRSNHCTYKGDWKNDKMDGFGTLKLTDGTVITCKFKEGYTNGYGILEDKANGIVKKRFFSNNVLNGKGIVLHNGIEEEKGVFVKNVISQKKEIDENIKNLSSLDSIKQLNENFVESA